MFEKIRQKFREFRLKHHNCEGNKDLKYIEKNSEGSFILVRYSCRVCGNEWSSMAEQYYWTILKNHHYLKTTRKW